jgi:phosphoribosylamine--glycine ligase
MTAEERDGVHYGDVRLDGDCLVTAGEIGYVLVVTGRGDTAQAARDSAYALAKKVVIPNMRYRTDIGERFIEGDRERLGRWGWLG